MGGQYYKKNGQHYLIYDETVDGFEGTTHNIVKFDEKKMEVHKKGLINVQMILRRIKRICLLSDSFGMMNMGVAATRISVREEEDSMDVVVDYALDMNESYVADCTIAMTVRAKKGRRRMRTDEDGRKPRRRCPYAAAVSGMGAVSLRTSTPVCKCSHSGHRRRAGTPPSRFSGCGLISIWRQTISRLTEGRNLGMSAEQAMTALGVSESERYSLKENLIDNKESR